MEFKDNQSVRKLLVLQVCNDAREATGSAGCTLYTCAGNSSGERSGMCKSAISASVFDLVDTGSVCCREHARTEPSFVYIYEAEEPHTKKVCVGGRKHTSSGPHSSSVKFNSRKNRKWFCRSLVEVFY